MSQRTAILGWGSLLWDGGAAFDLWHDAWQYDGPTLPLEFSRVSSSRLGALTLVVDEKHGAPVTVAWCLSKRSDPGDAVADLRCREGCKVSYIARLNLAKTTKQLRHDGGDAIAAWGRAHEVDTVVWTALPSNFQTEVKVPFSVSAALAYLKSLEPEAKAKAAEYIWRAPAFVRTLLRSAVEREPWYDEPDGS